jgi:hypothetical protein
MNDQPAQIVNLGVPSLSPQDAWSLWQRLGDLAQSLWDAYEKPFLEYCIQESEEFQRTHPMPFDEYTDNPGR